MVDRKRFLQPHQRKVLLQTIQKVEVHENVEKDYQAPKQNEGSKLPRGEAFHAPRSFQCPSFKA